VIDEDTAQVSRYTRNTWKSTLKTFVLSDDVGSTARALGAEDGPYTEQLNAFITEFHAEAVKVGLNKAPAADVDTMAGRIADALVARVPLSQITLSKALWASWTGPEEPAIPALVDIMRQLREATNAKLAQDPHFFESQDFLVAINQERQAQGLPPYEIRKSTDIPELLMAEYLTKNRRNTDTEVVFNVLGVDLYQVQRLYAAVNNYIGAVTLVLLSDADAKAQAYALIDGYKPGAP